MVYSGSRKGASVTRRGTEYRKVPRSTLDQPQAADSLPAGTADCGISHNSSTVVVMAATRRSPRHGWRAEKILGQAPSVTEAAHARRRTRPLRTASKRRARRRPAGGPQLNAAQGVPSEPPSRLTPAWRHRAQPEDEHQAAASSGLASVLALMATEKTRLQGTSPLPMPASSGVTRLRAVAGSTPHRGTAPAACRSEAGQHSQQPDRGRSPRDPRRSLAGPGPCRRHRSARGRGPSRAPATPSTT